jgi:glutaminase
VATSRNSWDRALSFNSSCKAAGEKLSLISEVYKSKATNIGNKVFAMLLAKYEHIYADPMESVYIYTKQCSVGVNAAQLARMGATLANPSTPPAERVIFDNAGPKVRAWERAQRIAASPQ